MPMAQDKCPLYSSATGLVSPSVVPSLEVTCLAFSTGSYVRSTCNEWKSNIILMLKLLLIYIRFYYMDAAGEVEGAFVTSYSESVCQNIVNAILEAPC